MHLGNAHGLLAGNALSHQEMLFCSHPLIMTLCHRNYVFKAVRVNSQITEVKQLRPRTVLIWVTVCVKFHSMSPVRDSCYIVIYILLLGSLQCFALACSIFLSFSFILSLSSRDQNGSNHIVRAILHHFSVNVLHQCLFTFLFMFTYTLDDNSQNGSYN